MDNYKGYYKVKVSPGGVETCTFYNPETKKEFSKITYDVDNDRLLYDGEIQALRFLQVNESVCYIWKHEKGIPQVGDVIEVIKGRKFLKVHKQKYYKSNLYMINIIVG